MPKNQSNDSSASLLSYLGILTAFFLLLEVSFFIQCNLTYLDDFKTISSNISIPLSILPGIIFFVCAQLAIHVFYCLLVWFSVIYCCYLFRLSGNTPFWLSLIIWFSGVAAALCANQYYFPNSKYAELFILLFPSGTAAGWLAALLAIPFVTAMITGMIGFLVWLTEKSFNYALLFLLFLSASSWIGLNQISLPPIHTASLKQPNVFIVGVDSLRPDFLSYFGSDLATPAIDNFLNHATVFSEAVTPLARTFPSWLTILTGEYPRHTGIRSNLINVDKMSFNNSLPSIFKQQGYRTIYATDETRFSNIDQTIGFNEILSPTAGLNDFILGTVNDFPFSNLLVNTALGHWLFPHSYASRAAFATYDPDSFIRLMTPAIMQSTSQPLFMAVHFCLPHFPYLFAAQEGGNLAPSARYQASVQRVDQQVRDYFQLLTRAHLLDHAIVILLSDHGEALELPGDRLTQSDHFISGLSKPSHPPRFYPPNLDDEAFNQSAGHGTDVLGLTQYHTLLAVQLFGMGQQQTGTVAGAFPLNDIKASLLTLAGIHQPSTGVSSLATVVRGDKRALPLQHIFLESDFSPASIRSVYPEVREAMMDGLKLYEVNPVTARLTVKPDMSKMILRTKQYADIYGNWMLALYPQKEEGYMPILVNLQSGNWTNNLQSSFARQSPAITMLAHLKQFFGHDISH